MAPIFLTTKVIAFYNTNLLTFVICAIVITLCVHSFPFILLITERCEFQEFNTFQTLVNKLARDFNLNGNNSLSDSTDGPGNKSE